MLHIRDPEYRLCIPIELEGPRACFSCVSCVFTFDTSHSQLNKKMEQQKKVPPPQPLK
jgi:hypothetical protein